MGWLAWLLGIGGPSLMGIAALAGGAFVWFRVPVFGRYAGLGLVALGVGLIAYAQGFSSARGDCQEAALRSELAIARADLDAAMRSARVAQELGEKLNAAESRNQELSDEIASMPDACFADEPTAGRLRSIK